MILIGTPGTTIRVEGSFYPPPCGRRECSALRRALLHRGDQLLVLSDATPAMVRAWAPPRRLLQFTAEGAPAHHADTPPRGGRRPRRALSGSGRRLGAESRPLFFQLLRLSEADGALRALLLSCPATCAAPSSSATLMVRRRVYETLHAHDAALCIADTDAGATPTVTASWGYLRLRDVGYDDASFKPGRGRFNEQKEGHLRVIQARRNGRRAPARLTPPRNPRRVASSHAV